MASNNIKYPYQTLDRPFYTQCGNIKIRFTSKQMEEKGNHIIFWCQYYEISLDGTYNITEEVKNLLDSEKIGYILASSKSDGFN